MGENDNHIKKFGKLLDKNLCPEKVINVLPPFT
jgi:hypothetical protein